MVSTRKMFCFSSNALEKISDDSDTDDEIDVPNESTTLKSVISKYSTIPKSSRHSKYFSKVVKLPEELRTNPKSAKNTGVTRTFVENKTPSNHAGFNIERVVSFYDKSSKHALDPRLLKITVCQTTNSTHQPQSSENRLTDEQFEIKQTLFNSKKVTKRKVYLNLKDASGTNRTPDSKKNKPAIELNLQQSTKKLEKEDVQSSTKQKTTGQIEVEKKRAEQPALDESNPVKEPLKLITVNDDFIPNYEDDFD
jgi:hypothetical protein